MTNTQDAKCQYDPQAIKDALGPNEWEFEVKRPSGAVTKIPLNADGLPTQLPSGQPKKYLPETIWIVDLLNALFKDRRVALHTAITPAKSSGRYDTSQHKISFTRVVFSVGVIWPNGDTDIRWECLDVVGGGEHASNYAVLVRAADTYNIRITCLDTRGSEYRHADVIHTTFALDQVGNEDRRHIWHSAYNYLGTRRVEDGPNDLPDLSSIYPK